MAGVGPELWRAQGGAGGGVRGQFCRRAQPGHARSGQGERLVFWSEMGCERAGRLDAVVSQCPLLSLQTSKPERWDRREGGQHAGQDVRQFVEVYLRWVSP